MWFIRTSVVLFWGMAINYGKEVFILTSLFWFHTGTLKRLWAQLCQQIPLSEVKTKVGLCQIEFRIIIICDFITSRTLLKNWKRTWETAIYILPDTMISTLQLFCFVKCFWKTRGAGNILDYDLGNELQVRGCQVVLN